MPSNDLDIRRMRSSAGRATEMLRALANEDRLLLLCQLVREEKCVSELEQALDIVQPTLSQQLGVLRRYGLVATRRDGKNIYYRVADDHVHTLLGMLYSLYCGAGAATTGRKRRQRT